MERNRNEFLDKIIILSILEKQNSDIYNIQDRILKLSNGDIYCDTQYLSVIMMRLRTEKLIEKDKNNPHGLEHRITEKGKVELAKRLRMFFDYEQIIKSLKKSKPMTDEREKFNNIYKSFTGSKDYLIAEKTLTDLIRTAFKTGWVSGGGTPPENSTVAELLIK